MSRLRVVLFVEGSRGVTGRDGTDPFEQLWTNTLTDVLDLRRVARVVPISKKNLITPAQAPPRPTSSMALPLDELLKREIARGQCDAAVVAWDLQPRWDRHAPACRVAETLDLYRMLATSAVLPPAWRLAAADRLRAVDERTPGAAARTPTLARGVTLAVCMEPDFEALLCDDGLVREALGLRGRRVDAWPTDWTLPAPTRGDELLQRAVLAAQRARPQPASVRRVRGDMRTAKHEWAAYILRHARATPHALARLRAHPIARRLRVCLPAGR